MRSRREDIQDWFDLYMQEWQDKYKRYIQLTNGARQFIQEYDWPGNLDQINSTCERIVLLTTKRLIDEVFLRKHLEQVTPLMTTKAEKVVVVQDPKALKISKLLAKHGGNREKVAAEMGISKTTLWRYIKKYNLEPNDE